jgi:hypothetical protein
MTAKDTPMIIKVLSAIIYIIVFIPVWLLRKLSNTGRFGSRFHQQASTWDLPTDLPVFGTSKSHTQSNETLATSLE